MVVNDDDLRRTCRRQFGVFSHAQARSAGLADSTVVRRTTRGRYRRLFPGVFMDASVPDSWEARVVAALLAVGGDVVAARTTAARALGLDLGTGRRHDAIHLLDRHRTFSHLPGVVVHRSKTIDDVDVVRTGVLSTTSVTRTLFDLAADVAPGDLRRQVADAVVLVGWRDPLRFNASDLDHHADEVVASVRRGLQRARDHRRAVGAAPDSDAAS